MPEKLPQSKIKIGFECETVDVTLDRLMPIRAMTPMVRSGMKYQQILASIREVGLIEPPAVTPDKQLKDRYIVLDGHLRLEALKEIGETEVTCLISTDDETFTYNHHINRISTVQEHRMILRAVERGVPEEKIAKALNLNVESIAYKINLLKGTCSEAVELLKDKIVATGVFAVLRQMQPFRQIEAATLMNDAKVYTTSYARALLAATPKNQLAEPDKPKKIRGLNEGKMARMESEMESLQSEYCLIEENYGTDVLNLTLAKGYVASLVSNARIIGYLAQHHMEILAQFQKIAGMKSLNAKDAA